MNELLSTLKADLSDRRLLPVFGALGLALAAALAYAVLAGKSSSTPSAATPPPTLAQAAAPTSTPATSNPNAAYAETTDGARYQRQEGAHNPFVKLPSINAATAGAALSTKALASTATGGSSASSGATTTTGSSGASTSTSPSGGAQTTPSSHSAPTTKPKQKKAQPVYQVAVLFGLAPTTPEQLSQLTPYANLKRLEALPSASAPRVVFTGVSDNGANAVFTLAGEAILKGDANCMPNASQCEAIALAVGKSEELSYLEPTGQSVTYELKVVSISKQEASAATAARLDRGDRAGQALLRRLDPGVLQHLRFSSAKGVLVYLTAARHPHRSRHHARY